MFDVANVLSARSFGAIEVTSSGRGKARSMHTCRCSMHNGLEAVGTALNSGKGSNWIASADSLRVVSEWATRRVAPKMPAISSCRRRQLDVLVADLDDAAHEVDGEIA
jgi:hypothetical protein